MSDIGPETPTVYQESVHRVVVVPETGFRKELWPQLKNFYLVPGAFLRFGM